jgi:hypothetical protein
MRDERFPPCVCRDHEPAAIDRPVLFLPMIVIMFGSLVFVFSFANVSGGLQLASLIPYTAFIVLVTFSAQRGQQPYFFECPIVHQAMPRLVRRYIGFLSTLLIVETVAIYSRQYLPGSWLDSGKNGSPVGIALWIFCAGLGMAEAITNRSLLEREHLSKQAALSLHAQ